MPHSKIDNKINDYYYDFSPCGYFTLNQDGVILSVNLAGAKLLEYASELLINKPFLNYVSYQSQTVFQAHIAKVIRQKSSHCQLELIKKGSQRNYVNIESKFVENQYLLLTVWNITLLKQFELKNIESQKVLFVLENLFQSSNDSMAVLNLDYQFIMVNKAFVHSFSKIFACRIKAGMNFLIILSDFPELKDKIVKAWEMAVLGHKNFVTIENDSEREEVYYYYEMYFNPIVEGSAEKTHRVSLTLRDMTEYHFNQRGQAKQQAILSSAARMNAIGEMAAALAHEINQPLAAINIYSHACLEHFNHLIQPHHRFSNALKKIRLLSQHAGEILHRMKNFMREGELCVDKIDINIIIKEALTFLDHQKIGTKLEIDLMLTENLPCIFLDKVKIIQVILNLSQNSIEAFQDANDDLLKITIKTLLLNNEILVEFKDNGPGIPEKLINRIFKSYFTTKSHGTGLGLGICRTIIEAHGGKLIIKASENNEGALIQFTLPILSLSDSFAVAH